MQSVVLLVDDDRLIHKLFEAKFKERSQSGAAKLIHAYDGEEGLEKLAQNPEINLILTDFQMPVMTGLEMIYRLKEKGVEIPTIVISSFDSMANLRSAMNAGAVDFAPKPVDFDDLFVSIDRTLEAAAKQAANQKARLQAEAEQIKLGKALDLTHGGLFLISPKDLKFLYSNKGGQELLGLEGPQLLQLDLYALIGDYRKDWLRDGLASLAAGKQQRLDFEFDYQTEKDPTPMEARLQLVPLEEREQLLVLSVWDISIRKQAQAQNTMLAKAIEQTRDYVMVTDKDRKFLYVNPAFEQGTGYSKEEALGKTPRILHSGRQSEEFYEELWKTLSSGHFWHGEVVNQKKNGKLFWTELSISPVTDGKGQIVNFIGVSRDKTKERALQAQLLQSQKMESIGTLAGGIAHEINNPIGFVYSNVGSLQTYLGDFLALLRLYHDLELFLESPDPKIKKILAEIEAKKKQIDLDFMVKDIGGLVKDTLEGAERIKSIVANLREFAHTGTGNMELSDLNDAIQKTLKLLNNELKFRIEVVTELELEEQVVCYPQEIKQVLLNLILNAAQAIPEKGTIHIKTAKEDSEAVIRIKDSGTGISPENMTRLFEPFFTTKGVGKGTGLGLSVSYNIIKKHQGKISAESKVGVGSIFTVRLPINPQAPPTSNP